MKKMLPKIITIGDKYNPAMQIDDQEEADSYFELLVQHSIVNFDMTQEEAETLERTNLGYYAGYYSHGTRLRVEKLFNCKHPIFGDASNGPPTPEEAFKAGVDAAKG